jgi:hypothetical protein
MSNYYWSLGYLIPSIKLKEDKKKKKKKKKKNKKMG